MLLIYVVSIIGQQPIERRSKAVYVSSSVCLGQGRTRSGRVARTRRPNVFVYTCDSFKDHALLERLRRLCSTLAVAITCTQHSHRLQASVCAASRARILLVSIATAVVGNRRRTQQSKQCHVYRFGFPPPQRLTLR